MKHQADTSYQKVKGERKQFASDVAEKLGLRIQSFGMRRAFLVTDSPRQEDPVTLVEVTLQFDGNQHTRIYACLRDAGDQASILIVRQLDMNDRAVISKIVDLTTKVRSRLALIEPLFFTQDSRG